MAIAVVVVAVAVGCLTAAGASAHTSPAPRWLISGERQFLNRVLERAIPVHVYYLRYPKKIAVVFEFDRIVVCAACSAPSNATLPRGRLIRVSFDRRTHAVLEADGLRFCETRGSYPPKSECLRR